MILTDVPDPPEYARLRKPVVNTSDCTSTTAVSPAGMKTGSPFWRKSFHWLSETEPLQDTALWNCLGISGNIGIGLSQSFRGSSIGIIFDFAERKIADAQCWSSKSAVLQPFSARRPSLLSF